MAVETTKPKQTAFGCALLIVLALALGYCISGGTPAGDSPEVLAKKAADRKAGFHCLSSGKHYDLIESVKAGLRDPNSFEHAETKITPVSARGEHALIMKYRARNGFGGMNAVQVMASVKNSDCSFTVLMGAEG